MAKEPSLRDLLPEDARHCTELHVHLGGSVPIYRLWEMGIARGIRGVADSYSEFVSLLHRSADRLGSLDDYLAIFDTVELIQAGPDAVHESIRVAINGAYRTGGMRRLGPGGEGGDPYPLFTINQLELRFNPLKRTGAILTKDHASGLFDVDRIIRAACESVEESELAYRGEIHAGLICCFGRDMSWETNRILAEKIANWRTEQKKIIGIDLAGPESARNLSDPNDLAIMAELYDIAAGDELGRTAHVGETEHIDLNTFIATLKQLKVTRVAHPVVAVKSFWDNKDARGLELMAENDICCELCIQSNLLTGAISSAEEYGKMLKTLDSFDIKYTFSTDSPALQMSTLAGELNFLFKSGNLSLEQAAKAIKTASTVTFIKA